MKVLRKIYTPKIKYRRTVAFLKEKKRKKEKEQPVARRLTKGRVDEHKRVRESSRVETLTRARLEHFFIRVE